MVLSTMGPGRGPFRLPERTSVRGERELSAEEGETRDETDDGRIGALTNTQGGEGRGTSSVESRGSTRRVWSVT